MKVNQVQKYSLPTDWTLVLVLKMLIILEFGYCIPHLSIYISSSDYTVQTHKSQVLEYRQLTNLVTDWSGYWPQTYFQWNFVFIFKYLWLTGNYIIPLTSMFVRAKKNYLHIVFDMLISNNVCQLSQLPVPLFTYIVGAAFPNFNVAK